MFEVLEDRDVVLRQVSRFSWFPIEERAKSIKMLAEGGVDRLCVWVGPRVGKNIFAVAEFK